jgi:DNA ligase-1
LKKDYLAGVGDSLYLVVVGGYYGKGKRTNVYGAFLLACYDADSEEYQTICKIGTGFSEEVLASHYATLQPLETDKARGDVKIGGAKPDVWFEPKVVWEVLTADLSLSPVYTAAQGLVVPFVCFNLFPMAYLSIRLKSAAFHCGSLAFFGLGMTKMLKMRQGRSR